MKTDNDPDLVPLPLRWRATALPWLLPLALLLFAVAAQAHWGDRAAALHVVSIAVLAATWGGLLSGRRWALRHGATLVNAVVAIQAVGGLVLERICDDPAGAEVLAELLFWAPALCAWWASCYYERLSIAFALAALLYAGFFAGGQLGLDRYFHKFLLEGGLMIGLVVLFGRTVGGAAFGRGPRAFDAARHDALTSVESRPYFEAEMAHTAAIGERYGQPFSLIVARLNDFPAYRKQFGAAEGDRLLRAFSRRLAERIRQADSVCRWQDEKFVVLLPMTRLDEAVKLAENMRHAMATAGLDERRPVSACFGVSEHRPGEDPMLTFDTADRALARARGNGENIVVVDGAAAAAVS